MSSKDKNLSENNIENIQIDKNTIIGIVVSEWNEEITEALFNGAKETLLNAGVNIDNIIKKYVPGSFELPLGAQYFVDYCDVDAVICLGCIIQGETRHFEFISQAVAQGIMRVGLDNGIPIIFGVLTTDNQQQAIDRAGGKHGNKGVEAAYTAIKMISLENELAE